MSKMYSKSFIISKVYLKTLGRLTKNIFYLCITQSLYLILFNRLLFLKINFVCSFKCIEMTVIFLRIIYKIQFSRTKSKLLKYVFLSNDINIQF